MATKIFKIPEGADRMDIPVTLCKLSDKQIGKYSTFRVVARTTIDESNTELKAFQAKLEAAKQKGDEKLYADLKKELPAMIIGKFSNRENEAYLMQL
jgi:hypothetical protein